MRVLHVAPSLCPTQGGPSKVVPGLTRALAREGISVDVATTNDNGAEPLRVPLNVPQAAQGVETYYLARQKSGSYNFSWALTRWLWKHVGKYDLVHIHSIFSYPTLIASRVAARMKRPYIVTPHGMVDAWCLEYKAWKKQPYLKLFENRTMARAAALHALVVEEKRALNGLKLGAPAFVVPNGIDLDELSALPPREFFDLQYPAARGKKIVLFMGRIDPKKGLDLLVKAFAQLVRETAPAQPFCLVIAGPDLIGHRAVIEQLTDEEKVREHVIFTGMLDGERKLAALNAADVFVLPSHSEGFSIAVLEALAIECPVIITEACNFPQVAKAGCGEVIPTDMERLIQALRNMFQSEERRREMGARGRRLIHAEYTWSAIGRHMREVYEDILRGTRHAAAWNNE